MALLLWLIVSPIPLGLAPARSLYAEGPSLLLSAPTIDSPPDLTFENNTRGKTINWNATDPSPKNYTISRNGTTFVSMSWSGIPISVALDHLYTQNLVTVLPITFVFTCTVFNTKNESASDSVNVFILPDETAPVIVAPDNFSYEAGSFDHFIKWNITEPNPDFYNITRTSNDTTSTFAKIASGSWDGGNISIRVDGLNATRWYLYCLFVNDTLGHNSTSYVNVTVFADVTPPTVTSPDDIALEYGKRGLKLQWTVYDSNPKNYSILAFIQFFNGSYGNTTDSRYHTPQNITQPDWTLHNAAGDPLWVTLDFLYVGNYTFTILLFDKFARSTNDTVQVRVYPDIRSPEVNATSDYSYEEGHTGNKVNWTIDETNPRSYNMTRNGTLLMAGAWRGENFSISADRLAVGVYVYNLTLVDFFFQTTISIVTVTVTPDAHPPHVAQVRVLQSFRDPGLTNLTVQAYVSDLNNVSQVVVYWGTDPSNPVSKNMTQAWGALYTANLGAYPVGVQVWYRVVGYDNSSVRNSFASEWTYVTVVSHVEPDPQGLIGAALGSVGILALLVVLSIYFRTRTR
ncbi:MAG: hypothetical protein HXY34_07510 [Candidatus Thorarchaeota archaeon]|nr:hypothetical protein [Candidatus Thorarchaeota archaeon]